MSNNITVEPTFPFRTNTSVVYSDGGSAGVPELVNRALAELKPTPPDRAYILVSNSLQKNHPEVVDGLRKALGERLVGERIGMGSHSPWNEIIEVTEECTKLSPNVLITLGGGSLTDATKLVSLLLSNPPSSGKFTYEHIETLTSASLSEARTGGIQAAQTPTINIPTTLSAGEYSPFAGAVDPRSNHKRGFAHPSIAPAAVLLDPTLATLTPEWVWLSTGVRAIDHCVETLCTLSSAFDPAKGLKEEDVMKLAADGLGKLVKGLLKSKNSPEDKSARLSAMLGARQSMAAPCQGLPLGASHGIGHQLGAMGVPHGYTSCILLPAVCEYNFSANGDRQERAVEVLLNAVKEAGLKVPDEVVSAGKEQRLRRALRWVFDTLGMPGSLEEVEVVGDDKLWELAEKSLEDRWVQTNPKPLENKEKVMEILRMVERKEKK